MTPPTSTLEVACACKAVKEDRSASAKAVRPGRRNASGSAWSRLPLVGKILLPIFAMTVCTGLAAAVFFTGQEVARDRLVQATEGRTIAAILQEALAAMPDDPATVGSFLHKVDLANGRVTAICVLTANPEAQGRLIVYASSGPASQCDSTSALVPGQGGQPIVSEFKQTATAQVEDTEAAAVLPGRGAVVEVQVGLTPVAEVAVPMFEKVAGTGLLLGVFQTALVFGVLWISALRPLRHLRLKASAAAQRARRADTEVVSVAIRSGDEIDDLSQRFEEMLIAVQDREQELVASHEKLETLISNSPVLVFSTDGEGVLLQIQGNEVGSIAADIGRDSLVGLNLLQIVQRNAELTSLVYRALDGERVHEVVRVRNWMSSSDPKPVHLDMLMYPTHGSDGRPTGIAGLALNVSDRMDAESARAESRQKSAFLAAMSHELRTPLNSIMGFSQLLERSTGTAALNVKQMRYAGHIYSSGEHLLKLIGDILDLAKVGAGQMEVNLEPVAVHDEVKDPIDKMRPLAVEKGLMIEMDVPLDLTSLTDRLRVRQIMLNLLSNAVKFSVQNGGPILVSGRSSGDGVEISVADSGIGIAAAEQGRIFEEFTQVDGGPSRRLDGTGLGLALTKKMVDLLGGNLRVDSKLGSGSTFTIWLPGVAAGVDSRPLATAHAATR